MTDSPTAWGLTFGVAAYVAGKLADGVYSAVTRNHQARDARRDSIVGQIEKTVLETRDLAVVYWCHDGSVPDEASRRASIVGRLTFISGLVAELFEKSPEERGAAELEYVRFHERCTSGDFGSARRKAEPERAADIEIAAYGLIHRSMLCRQRLKRPFFA